VAKPTGIIPALLDYKIDFGSDFDKVFGDGTDIYGICTGLLSTGAQVATGTTEMLVDYNLESTAGRATAKNLTVAEGEVLISAIIGVQGTATATVITTTDTCYMLGSYSASKANSANKKYWNNTEDPNAGGIAFNTLSLTFGSAPTTYTVTYYDENGSTPALQTTADLSSGATTPAAPAYTPATGYQLDGWSTTQGGAVESIPATVSANASYYAVVSQIDYTVTFYNGDDPVSTKTDYHYGDTLVAPADPSKAGFTFSGWSTSPSGAVADLPETVTGTQNFYAQFASSGSGLPADIERKVGRDIAKFTTANGALKTLKKDQFATVETDADYYVTEFDTDALDFAEYDYAVAAYEYGNETPHVFDKIDGANLAEVGGNINFFVIIKKVTNRAKDIVNIVVKALEK
jgi:uncharacterized repeat protein (TIGR02543 family)